MTGTRSPWQAESAAPTLADALPDEADVVVVGAGVTGAGTAWALAEQAPGTRTVVLDAHGPAHGASGRNAGFLLLGTHIDYASAVDAVGREAARALWALTRENLALARRLAETADVQLRLPGSVVGAGSDDEADRLWRARALLAEDGVDAEWLAPDEIERRVGARGLHGAVWVREGGEVNPQRLVTAALAASGATVVGHAEVVGLDPESDGVRVRLRDGRAIRAPRVAVCLNAWLPRLVPSLSDAIRPTRAQMLVTAPLPPTLAVPLYTHEGYFYTRQRPDGRLLLGGARHLHRDAEVGYEDAVTEPLQRDLEGYLDRHLGRRGAPIERRWSGTMAFSPDDLPLVGDVPGVPGAVYAGGFTGHGMGMGLRTGRLVARRLRGEPDVVAPLLDAARLGV